ncbi:SIR2 family protein [Sulfuritalea sp.]|uniref:SIR2 family protein n=1 Tax=Sulfuritalea sp. TaxID=2480090 RepID=UPI00286D9866|nr:SIR2 family protein [Sulfuritalea sp.]
MIPTELLDQWQAGLTDGSIVPYLGPGVLAGVTSKLDGRPIPATGEQLILAMNNGQPMAPKLMYEFPRAAMNIELKRGRSTVTRFLDATYATSKWTRAALHDWLAEIAPPYVIDINRDTQLQDSYAHMPHLLILGCARIGGTDYRFKLYAHDGDSYAEIDPTQADPALPVLFKPMGAPLPKSSYIASDADYVDYITELMGGFAVPAFVKAKRKGKRYLLLGMRLDRDSERMVFSDLIYDAAKEPAGWALIAEPTDKERRFCAKQGLELVEAELGELVAELAGSPVAA